METQKNILNLADGQIKTAGDILSDMLRSNSPFGLAYREHMAENSMNHLKKGGRTDE